MVAYLALPALKINDLDRAAGESDGLALELQRLRVMQEAVSFFDRSEAGESRMPDHEPGPQIGELRDVVLSLLPTGYPKLGRVASKLGVARRTLQRRLASADTSYTDLVSQTRFQLAAKMLEDCRRPISSIATAAGFANHSGFSRAFHRWTGMTPRQYRRHAGRER